MILVEIFKSPLLGRPFEKESSYTMERMTHRS